MEQGSKPNFTMLTKLEPAMKTGRTLFGVAMTSPSLEFAETIAPIGYDWIFIDAEDVLFTPATLKDTIHCIISHGDAKMIPIVRVPFHRSSLIAVALDAGVGGIALPQSRTREDIQRFIDMCRFHSQGEHLFPFASGSLGSNNKELERQSNFSTNKGRTACFAQIDLEVGVDNAREINFLDDIDGIMIGVNNLRLDLDLLSELSCKEPESLKRIHEIEALGQKYNKSLMGIASPRMQAVWEDKVRSGYQMLICTMDPHAWSHSLATECAQTRGSYALLEAEMRKEMKGETKTVSEEHANDKRLDDGSKVKESGHKWHLELLSVGMYADPASWVPGY
ncbi:Phosphoenolpyruvate/pyruvate domain-containing protein [Serendipita vermifera]|nr:Phosphoenolpyruvate/pyruvate domain-containing protein [Serendipita vermifera]